MLLVGMIIPMSAQIKGTVTDTYNNPVKYAKVASKSNSTNSFNTHILIFILMQWTNTKYK